MSHSPKPVCRVGIAGTGSHMPSKVLTNADLSDMVDTSDEWIVKRTGMRERRILEEDRATSDMASEAAKCALENSGIDPKDLDLILVGTVSGDHIFPSTACLVQRKIGAVNAAAFDLSAACSGFLFALTTGKQFVATGRYKRVLVIGAECLSRILNYEDRSSCILFGDGAGAAILAPWEETQQGEILHSTMGSDGEGFEMIWIPGGGSKEPISQKVVDEKLQYMIVHGREVYKFAVNKMVELVKHELSLFPGEELGALVPHQVNLRIIESAIDRLAIPREKVIVNIDKYGNTSSASIPVALDEAQRSGKIPKGKLTVFVAFGAGLAWGSSVIRW